MSDSQGNVLYRYYRTTRFWLRQLGRWIYLPRNDLNPEKIPYSDDEWP